MMFENKNLFDVKIYRTEDLLCDEITSRDVMDYEMNIWKESLLKIFFWWLVIISAGLLLAFPAYHSLLNSPYEVFKRKKLQEWILSKNAEIEISQASLLYGPSLKETFQVRLTNGIVLSYFPHKFLNKTPEIHITEVSGNQLKTSMVRSYHLCNIINNLIKKYHKK